MPATTRCVDFLAVISEFCDGNISYAAPSLDDAVWVTSAPDGDYVVSLDQWEAYEYAVKLDRKNAALPPPLHIAVICELAPTHNLLTADLHFDISCENDPSFGVGSGLFVDFEVEDDTQFKQAWSNLMNLAGAVLPEGKDPSDALGMFRVLEFDNPAFSFTHRFVEVRSRFITFQTHVLTMCRGLGRMSRQARDRAMPIGSFKR